ncbi:electron transport complex subunit RsxG [soil metagenome]
MKDAEPTWRRAFAGAGLLALFAIIAVGLLAVAERLARDRIDSRERVHALETLHAVISPSRYDNDLLEDRITVRDRELLGTEAPVPIYRARRNGQPVAAILLPVAPDGYSGPIRLMVGINADGSVAAVRVIAHSETPGLGDGIELARSNWIRQFTGRALDDPDEWAVSRDGGNIDQLTGATVTSRAVVEAVRDALLYFQKHREQIFSASSAS